MSFNFFVKSNIDFGRGALADLSELIKSYNLKSVMIVYDGGVKAAGIADKVVRTFDRFGVDKARFVGYWREPAKVTGASDIYVSCHVRDNKVLAVIGHVGKPHVNQTFEVTFDWAKLNAIVPEVGS